ncbi:MAG: CopG family transcriptional regulator [Rhizobiaceae bacterium]|nr:CopG family transcriptional regulator [Rhizobiaceae bacterium]
MVSSDGCQEQIMTISVNLPQELEARLKALAEKSGQATDVQLRQIIDAGLEDMEDYYAGQDVLARIARGEEKVLTSEEFWRGMDS